MWKLVIEMVLKALATFGTVQRLMEKATPYLKNPVKRAPLPNEREFFTVIQLQGSNYEHFENDLTETVKVVRKIKKI